MKKTLLFLGSIFISAFAGNQLSAQILQGSTTVNAGNNMVVTVTVNTATDVVDITATGPDGVWFGYGFGGGNMTNRYSVITDGNGGIEERKLGNHNSGSLLTSSFTSSTSTVSGGIRTTTVSRPRVGLSGDYYTFPNTPGSFTIIWARGNGVSLSQHSSSNRGSSMVSLASTVSVDEFALSGVNIYPNPATNSISIDLQNAAPHQISVINSFGQKLVEEKSAQEKTMIQLANLAAGVYYIEVVLGNKTFRQKIVKQ